MACTGASKLWVLVILLVTAVAHIARYFTPDEYIHTLTLDKAKVLVHQCILGKVVSEIHSIKESQNFAGVNPHTSES